MEEARPPIVIVRTAAHPGMVHGYATAWFGDMVKIVVDVNREVIALGGELHADGEDILLADGSRQADLWGANVYPLRERADRLDCTALINIRPGQGNRSMEVQDPAIRRQIEAIVDRLLPPGAPP